MKKSFSKTKVKPASVQIEHSGHWSEGNTWFKLGLSKTEASLLKAIASDIFTRKPKSAVVARVLLQAALAHYDVLKPLMLRDAGYSEDEGFTTTDCFLKGVITQQLAKIAGVKGVSK